MDRYAWAERNDGLVTTKVLEASGRSRRGRDVDRASGRLVSVRRSVYAIAGAPKTWRQHVRAVLLAAGPAVAAGHVTALRWLGGARIDGDTVHVLAPLGRQVTMAGVTAHRSGSIEDGDIIVRDGVACTSPLRTVLDLSGALNERELGSVIDDFVRRRMLDLETLRARVERTRPAPGRSVAKLRRVLAQRVPGYDPGESELEARIARIIDQAGFPRPSQQHRVSYGSARYRIDFAWPERRLYLEGNGFGFHRLGTDLDRDARRQNELVLDGWRPIEITWRMTDREIERTVQRFLAQRV